MMSGTKHSIRGRNDLKFVASVDAILLGYAVIVLLLALDTYEGFDTILLIMHSLHLLTVLTTYVVVRHSTTSLDMLRVLIAMYFIVAVVDSIVCLLRLFFLGHSDDVDGGSGSGDDDNEIELKHMHVSESVRLVLAGLFVVVDILGAFYANLAQSSATDRHYSNNDFLRIGEEALLASNVDMQSISYQSQQQQHVSVVAAGGGSGGYK